MDELPQDDVTVKRSAARTSAADGAASMATASGNDDAALPIGTRIREFEVKDVLGQGGFSIVYGAWDHSLHRNVALKEYIPAEFAYRNADLRVTVRSYRHQETFDAGLRSFVEEARILAHFDHRSLVKVHQFWEDRGTAFMVMPLYKGPTLKQALAGMTHPPPEDWLSIMLGHLSEALAVVHAADCFHRDISPDNIILVGPEQMPLLLDFGAARRIIGDMTQNLTVILKSGYAPIEQYGEIPGMRQGPWTDVYALAAVAYFAIRGKTPPPAVGRAVKDTYVELAASPDAGYSLTFRAAIDQALSVLPEHRTPSVAAFRRGLGFDLPQPAASTDGDRRLPARARRDSSSPPVEPATHRAGRRHGAVWVGSCAAAVVVALLVRFYFTRQETSPMAALNPVPQTDARPEPDRASPRPALAATGNRPITGAVATAPPPAPASAVSARELADPETAQRGESEARRAMQGQLATLEQLGQDEERDVRQDVAAVKKLQLRAEQETGTGHFEQAMAIDREGAAVASKAIKRVAGELVASYADLAKRATEANQLGIAEKALAKAKRFDMLRR